MPAFSVASFNLNKGLHTRDRAERFLAWLSENKPELLLLQEPWSEGRPVRDIPGYEPLNASWLVACYASSEVNRRFSPASIRRHERWVQTSLAGVDVHNVYLDDKSSAARRDLLTTISTAIDSSETHCFFGDFNMAPREEDGLYDGKVSKYTRLQERNALHGLLAAGCMIDVFANRSLQTQEFTFERTNKGRPTQFRCDLALVNEGLSRKPGFQFSYVHEARSGANAFTDHSGVFVTIDV
jgi:exonuclease III